MPRKSIYRTKTEYWCHQCLKWKPKEQFNVPGRCTLCHNEFNYRLRMENLIEQYPTAYDQCSNEDCNWIFSKARKNSKCPRCKHPPFVDEYVLGLKQIEIAKIKEGAKALFQEINSQELLNAILKV